MGQTLEQFSQSCHNILKSEPGPVGRRHVCELLESLLKDEAFTAKYLPDGAPDRKILYEDPELGFCILGHVSGGAKDSKPHDHGSAWAIYGQARGETEMTDWKLLEAPSESKPGKVQKVKSYMLQPGMACLYNEGDLHSPRREAETRLIRIEGKNMEKVKRFSYEAA